MRKYNEIFTAWLGSQLTTLKVNTSIAIDFSGNSIFVLPVW